MSTNTPTPVDVTKITKGRMRTDGYVCHIRPSDGVAVVVVEVNPRNITTGEREANAAMIAEAFNVANETGLSPLQMQERLDEAVRENDRMRDALYELADAVIWSEDDADFKAPEQFTKGYVFGRYLTRLATIARAVKDLHPLPSTLTKHP